MSTSSSSTPRCLSFYFDAWILKIIGGTWCWMLVFPLVSWWGTWHMSGRDSNMETLHTMLGGPSLLTPHTGISNNWLSWDQVRPGCTISPSTLQIAVQMSFSTENFASLLLFLVGSSIRSLKELIYEEEFGQRMFTSVRPNNLWRVMWLGTSHSIESLDGKSLGANSKNISLSDNLLGTNTAITE